MRLINSDKVTLKETETYYDLDDLIFIDSCLAVKQENEAIESLI